MHFFATSYAFLTHRDGNLRTGSRRARAHPRRDGRTARVGQLLLGLLTVGIGVGLTIAADLGVASWDVVHVGLGEVTGWSVGRSAITVGVGAALLATLIGERPRIGSLVPLAVVGPAIDLTLLLVPTARTLGGQAGLLVAGMLVLALGVGAYVTSDHGAGPSDLLFLALARHGLSISVARFVVDGAAVLGGWAIGGPVGIGTVLLTIVTPTLIGASIRLFDLVPARLAVIDRDLAFDGALGRELDWELGGAPACSYRAATG